MRVGHATFSMSVFPDWPDSLSCNVWSVEKSKLLFVAYSDECVSVLQSDDVRGARPLRRGLDVELDLSPFRQVLSADILHVEENVFVVIEIAVVSRNETVTASIVEEVNFSVCHCKQTYAENTDNSSASRGTAAPDLLELLELLRITGAEAPAGPYRE